MGKARRWLVAGLVTLTVFAVATWLSGAFVIARLLPSPDTRWPAALGIGAVAAGFAVAWGASWATQTDKAAGLSLAEVADGLAGRLRSQWEREAEARGLNDPYPLPVAWTAAEAPVAGDLDVLKKLATSGAGWSASEAQNWAKKPEDLAGGGDKKLADVLATVPTGRLVVLGEPGTGKTMLMVGLVLDMLHPGRRSSGGPVPVLASLASWDPASQDLHDWLGTTLITGYPDLADAAPPGTAGDNRFDALLEAGLILPVLDGLDEIPESARPEAITRINKELKPGEQLVVTCRTEQYQSAASPPDGQGTALRAATIQLSILKFDDIASYLRKDAGPAAEVRWDFLDTLGADSPVRQALATPLMAGLARAIYNPRPDERARDLRHPAELCYFADRPTVEAHLFDAFIPAAYRPPTACRWTVTQAEAWLVFLARHLEQTISSPDLAWWQLREAAPRSAFRLRFGLVAGLVAALTAGPAAALIAGLAAGLVAALTAGLAAGLGLGITAVFEVWLSFGSAKTPARGTRINVRGLGLGLVVGLVVGLVAVLVAGLRVGLVGGLAAALLTGYALGLEGMASNLARVPSPRAVLARDRRVTLLQTLACGLVFGLVGVIATGFVFESVFVVLFTLAGGLVVGFGVTTNEAEWPSYVITRQWLAFHHRLPWSLMRFLADAHQRGVLRQAGAVYQFRHIELQHRLANRDADQQQANP